MADTQIIGPGRLEAFSDGVIAIIITIMVLELHVPHSVEPADLWALWPVFLSYLTSFMVVAIYWVNHHRLFHGVKHVDNPTLWTNIIWLFFLSLVPFFTAFMGQNHLSSFSAAMYGCSLLTCAFAYLAMRAAVVRGQRDDPHLAATGRAAMHKNYVSLALYALGIPLAYVHPLLTVAVAFIVGAMYFLPEFWVETKAR